MKNAYGPDSGLFLRSTERGQGYQALIGYQPESNDRNVASAAAAFWAVRK